MKTSEDLEIEGTDSAVVVGGSVWPVRVITAQSAGSGCARGYCYEFRRIITDRTTRYEHGQTSRRTLYRVLQDASRLRSLISVGYSHLTSYNDVPFHPAPCEAALHSRCRHLYLARSKHRRFICEEPDILDLNSAHYASNNISKSKARLGFLCAQY